MASYRRSARTSSSAGMNDPLGPGMDPLLSMEFELMSAEAPLGTSLDGS